MVSVETVDTSSVSTQSKIVSRHRHTRVLQREREREGGREGGGIEGGRDQGREGVGRAFVKSLADSSPCHTRTQNHMSTLRTAFVPQCACAHFYPA